MQFPFTKYPGLISLVMGVILSFLSFLSEGVQADPASSEIIDFYLGKGHTPSGHSIHDVWKFTDKDLDYHHDFIQYIFPLDTPSGVIPNAPLVGKKEKSQFKENPDLKKALEKSFDLMARHYGFHYNRKLKEHTVEKDEHFKERISAWLYFDSYHHFRRITRIIESLRLLGRPDLALDFYYALDENLHDCSKSEAHEHDKPCVSDITVWDFWKDAAGVRLMSSSLKKKHL